MRPFPILFLLFLAVPITEMYILIAVGGIIGALPTIGLVVLTAIIGAALMRSQGTSTMNAIQRNMAEGKVPAMELAEGAAILFAGALLLTPGFVTDTIGFLCLTPPVRRALIRRVVAKRMQVHTGFSGGFGPHADPGPQPDPQRAHGPDTGPRTQRVGRPPFGGSPRAGDVYEGEFRREDD